MSMDNIEQYKVVGPKDPVFAVAGEDVILPCFVKPSISVVDMRVEWFRPDLKDSQVHLYDDHVDKYTDQIQSYRERTKLNHQELQRGNASLKLSSVRVSDEGLYKCFIQYKSWSDDATVNVKVEAVGRPPVITVDGFDHSGGLHLQCESEGWYPEPDLEWLNSEGNSVNYRINTVEYRMNTFNYRMNTVNYSMNTVNYRMNAVNYRMNAVNYRMNTVNYRMNTVNYRWRRAAGVMVYL
ncbi:butyrophilin 3 [Labeo rohita]|uniref:Butyrophilin 3 n=1 Tax=Labeo rohita TaxID=84645 RepID=A0A498LND7_LABRO|nr:butyrophilin 3 [Labeo rohita]